MRPKPARSGDDVGHQESSDPRDLVLEQELALLQPLDLELVEDHVLRNARDHIVEIAMFALQIGEASPQDVLVSHGTDNSPGSPEGG